MFPTDHRSCREAFADAAVAAGSTVDRYPLDALGPAGEPLWVSVARFGPVDARRTAVVMSGVHGVEGPAGSALQVALLRQGVELAHGCALVMIHGVNPWGMAWLRRQNERNVDLNRNWIDHPAPTSNPAYADVHDLLCPAGAVVPDGDDFVQRLGALSRSRGLDWVRRAVSSGQYSHPDGLYYGGSTLEASTRLVRRIADDHIGTTDELSILDLHTGHGGYGAATLLSRAQVSSDEAAWLRSAFPDEAIESSAAADDDLVSKSGQLALGLVRHIDPAVARTATLEIGTRSETRMIVAERAEHWVHQHGDRDDPAHQAVVTAHLECSIPDDADWHASALEHGTRVLRAFVTAAIV